MILADLESLFLSQTPARTRPTSQGPVGRNYGLLNKASADDLKALKDRSHGSAHLPTRPPARFSAAATPGFLIGTSYSRREISEGRPSKSAALVYCRRKAPMGTDATQLRQKGNPIIQISLAMLRIVICLISFCSFCADYKLKSHFTSYCGA